MSEEQELEVLKAEILEQWSQAELVKLVLRQQKLIEKLEQEIEKLKEKQPTNSKTSEKQQELVWELGGIEIGTGTLHATNARVAEAVAAAVEALWGWAPAQANVHVDETPWCVKGVKEWLWTAAGENFCLFHAADTRSRAELETMLVNEFAGVLSSDDFSAGRVTRHAVYWDLNKIKPKSSLNWLCKRQRHPCVESAN